MGVLSTLYIVFALKEDGNIDSDFLVSYYDTDCWHKGVQAIAAEGARNHGLLNITPADYFETVLTVPSNVKEQHQIGTFFAKLDSLITLHQRECFSFDFGSRSAKVAQKTISWEQRKLGEISESFEYGLNAAATEYDGKHKYIRITDIDDSTHLFIQDNLTSPDIDFSTADDYLLQAGDVLFARTGASVGKTYIYRSSDGDLYFAGFLIRAKIKRDYDADFVFQNTLTDNYDSYIRITSQRSGQPGVNAQEYANFALSVPCLAEQKKIGAYFTNLDNLITLHQREPPKEDKILNDIKTDTLFHEYYCQWLVIYKEGSVRGVTMQ
ncbi:MAG: restriction endonuclease subunit S, partial [Oribacterium sp.]|nr:restriction endonuclease subunit S [Oribacterium sp.]